MTTVLPTAAPSPVPLAERALGPDLARGTALLGIALANLVGWLHGRPWTVLLKQAEAAPLDRTADVLVALLADNRGFPLFALLFGYGLGVLHRRSLAAGERPGHFRIRMLKRLCVLGAIGVAHGVLLFSGDILVAYAVIGLLCVLLMGRGRLLLPLAGLATLPALGLWGWIDGTVGLGGGDGYASAATATYAEAVSLRAVSTLEGLALAPVNDLGLLTPMVLGAMMARAHLLERVDVNADLLRPLARWGLGIGLLGAVPLTAVLVLDPGHERLDSAVVLGSLGVLHQLSGLLGALGLAAACALLAERARGSRALGALAALGATALTAYLAQSLLAALVFPPYTLDLGARWGTAPAAALVTSGWLAAVLAATAWRRTGRRGPVEALLRRLAGSTRPAPGGAP